MSEKGSNATETVEDISGGLPTLEEFYSVLNEVQFEQENFNSDYFISNDSLTKLMEELVPPMNLIGYASDMSNEPPRYLLIGTMITILLNVGSMKIGCNKFAYHRKKFLSNTKFAALLAYGFDDFITHDNRILFINVIKVTVESAKFLLYHNSGFFAFAVQMLVALEWNKHHQYEAHCCGTYNDGADFYFAEAFDDGTTKKMRISRRLELFGCSNDRILAFSYGTKEAVENFLYCLFGRVLTDEDIAAAIDKLTMLKKQQAERMVSEFKRSRSQQSEQIESQHKKDKESEDN